MRISREHGMAKQEARDAVEGLMPKLLAKFGDDISDPKSEWAGDSMTFSFRAKGFGIKGTLKVTDMDLVLDIKLPFAARLFEGTIRSNAERAIDEYLRHPGGSGLP